MADILIIHYAVMEVGAVLQVAVKSWNCFVAVTDLGLDKIVIFRWAVDPSCNRVSDEEEKDNSDDHKQNNHSHRYDDDNNW